MKKIILITLIFCLHSFQSYSDELEGEMQCKIKKQTVHSVNDGKTQSFSGIKDGLFVNDFFNIKYVFRDSFFYLKIFTKPKNKNIAFNITYEIDFLNPNIDFEKNKNSQYVKAIVKDERVFLHQFIKMRRNKVHIGYLGEAQTIIKRYYKSDWEGTFSENISLTDKPINTHFYSYNCTHLTEDNLDKILKSMLKINP